MVFKGGDKDERNIQGQTPLYVATYHGRTAAALALVGDGADVNVRWSHLKTPLVCTAAEFDRAEILRALVERGADIGAGDTSTFTALHMAAATNRVGAIDVLVKAGASIEARVAAGHTPLCLAVSAFQRQAVLALKHHGADVNAVSDSDQTPLKMSAALGSADRWICRFYL